MPLSSDYAAPIELHLRAGRHERVALTLACCIALAGVASAALPAALAMSLALLILGLAGGLWQRAQQRPECLILYADGVIGCGERADPQPARLLQVSTYAQLQLVHFLDDRNRSFSVPLFGDRNSADLRQRLRLWLAAHRPDSEVAA